VDKKTFAPIPTGTQHPFRAIASEKPTKKGHKVQAEKAARKLGLFGKVTV